MKCPYLNGGHKEIIKCYGLSLLKQVFDFDLQSQFSKQSVEVKGVVCGPVNRSQRALQNELLFTLVG